MAKVIARAQTAEEVRDVLTTPSAMTALLKDPEAFVDWVEGSIEARLAKDPGILAQVQEQSEAFMINWLKENGQNREMEAISRRLNLDTPNARTHIRRNTIYNKNAIGAPYDKSFDSLTNFIHGISGHAYKTDELSKVLGSLSNELSSIKPSDGGFLIPEILRAEVLRLGLEKAVVRSRARVIPMDSLTVSFPKIDSTSNVSSVYGGIVGFWTEEGATLSESSPKFGKVELKANKLVLYTEVPTELIRDSRPAMDAFLGEIFPEAMTWFEDVAFFVGGGVGEPLGFLNAPANIAVTRSATVAGDNVEWVDIVNMFSRMLPQSLDRAVWVISPDVLPSLLTMTLPGNVAPVIMGGGAWASGSSRPSMYMLGLPIIVSEKARAIGSAGDINLVDFGFYLLGDRQAMSARQSEDFKFDQDKIAFRVIERLDGRPWLDAPVTPQNNGATLSPFVQLTDA